jgi:hypothetical protein
MKPINESVLSASSAASDIQSSGGVVTIAGLSGTDKRNITSILQTKYRAEVVQVVSVGATSYTPTASTAYTIEIGDTNRTRNGVQEVLKRYTYVTPPVITTLGATAALQREAIHGELVSKINADTGNFVTAASLLLGTGLSITDDAGYYPVPEQGMTARLGASTVRPCTNADGTGFADDNYSVTTAAVYSFGVGADLAEWRPVIDQMWGNLISGYLGGVAPKTTAGAYATSGQNYDGFAITSLTTAAAHNQKGQLAYVPKVQIVYADNGTGSSTTNLTGFKAFERVMHKLMVQVYEGDASTLQEWFDAPIVFQDPLGAAPTGTANTLGWQLSRYTPMNRTNIGTQTIVAPVLAAAGLLLDQDDTAGEGSHTSANQQTLGDQSFIVGKTPFMVGCRVVAADWTDTQFIFGFRKKAVYTADYNDYTDLAAIGGGAADGDSVYTFGILNNAATVATDTAVNFTDAVSAMMWVKVDINGNVTCFLNGTEYPVYSAGTTDLVFDAGDEMIAFYQHLNIGGGDPAVTISEFFAVPTDQLIQ